MKNSSNINSEKSPFTIDVEGLNEDNLSYLTKENATDEQIKDMLQRLPFKLSAEAKLAIFNILQFSVKIGNSIVRIGKKILEIVLMIASKYPNTTFGLIIAAMLTLLISLIPVLGGLLASFLGPIIAIFGLTVGFFKDLKNSNPTLVVDIEKASDIFSPLRQAI